MKIYGYVFMRMAAPINHIYLIVQSEIVPLSDILRDFKTGLAFQFTSKQIMRAIENNYKESRKKWLLWLLKKEENRAGVPVWFWEEGYHGEEIYSEEFFLTKLKYMHLNPVRAGIVLKEEEYLNSFVVIITEQGKALLNLQNFNRIGNPHYLVVPQKVSFKNWAIKLW